ncbi:hypothetical protein [Bradyrhizobium sp. CW1]|uniref:hypothetical protein n=1 Tax=Bradyrhizobium sp. CW1 TaxID=2782686 RepID=UPI001FFE9373|nr:hypothetical protein [Bradyrhizobium sp. CW1]UPJ31012.1 hypothetical protein IVB54_19405 [Bradyrhizobium sp. CW1]
MAENYDERSFEDRMQGNFRNRTGEDWSPQKTVDSFTLYGPEQRAQALDQLDVEISRTEISNNPTAIKTAASRLALKRELQSLHQKMLAVRR